MADDDCTDGLTLLRYADLALYAAKNERKGSLKRFVAEMDVAAQDKARLESDLREASRSLSQRLGAPR